MAGSRQTQESTSAITLAFLLGAVTGAGIALLLAPEPGQTMRRRLAHGAKAAQEELSEVAAETRDALGALGKDARQTLKQTATRLSAALDATRQAMKHDESGTREPVTRRLPNRKA